MVPQLFEEMNMRWFGRYKIIARTRQGSNELYHPLLSYHLPIIESQQQLLLLHALSSPLKLHAIVKNYIRLPKRLITP